MIAWNTDKTYLARLEAAGIPVVPSAFVTQLQPLGPLLEQRGWDQVVVKPSVGAGGRGAQRVRADAEGDTALAEALALGCAVVQPYLAAVETAGETSVLFIDGEPSHAVVKLPAAGEFRIQHHRGGTSTRVGLDDVAPMVAIARRAMATVDEHLLYGRADFVPGDDGAPLLVELELSEPSLFLRNAPEAAARLADAIATLIRSAP